MRACARVAAAIFVQNGAEKYSKMGKWVRACTPLRKKFELFLKKCADAHVGANDLQMS